MRDGCNPLPIYLMTKKDQLWYSKFTLSRINFKSEVLQSPKNLFHVISVFFDVPTRNQNIVKIVLYVKIEHR